MKRVFAAMIGAALCAGVCVRHAAADGKEQTMPGKIEGRKVLMVIASHDFRDEEFEKPFDILKKAGAEVRVASSATGKVVGALGRVVEPDLALSSARGADWDAVVFVGGPGASEYFDDPDAHRLAREAAEGGKVLGAICIAPAILANAGVLNGRKAVCFPSVSGMLKAGGAALGERNVERDGKIVTAAGPQAAAEFGQALVAALKQ